MTVNTLLKKLSSQDTTIIGKDPVAILPLNLWEQIQDYLEDIAMTQSHGLKKEITKARREVKDGRVVKFEDLISH